MHNIRKRRVLAIIASLLVIIIVVSLIMYALRQNISLFYTPTQLQTSPMNAHIIRVGGMVVKHSVLRSTIDKLTVKFKLTDFKHTIMVAYRGILPDLFRDGQGVVVTGYLKTNHTFHALEVLAKHDANYMPPEIRNIIKKIE